jgi:hypothetical protein
MISCLVEKQNHGSATAHRIHRGIVDNERMCSVPRELDDGHRELQSTVCFSNSWRTRHDKGPRATAGRLGCALRTFGAPHRADSQKWLGSSGPQIGLAALG